MSCSLYITRAASFCDGLKHPITAEEWRELARDDESLVSEDGTDYFRVIWKNPEDPEGYYSIDWFEGVISADVTSTAVIRKLLEIAAKLNASVLDDGDKKYIDDTGYPVGWQPQEAVTPKKPFWKFW